MGGRIIESVLDGDLIGNDRLQFDLTYGGQQGHMAALGRLGPDGQMYSEWVSNAAYVNRDVIPIVLTPPKFFSLFPNKRYWENMFVSLMELHSVQIDGLNGSLTIEDDDSNKIGRYETQEEFTRVSREKSNPKHMFKEKMNLPIANFWNAFARYGMEDPDVGLPLASRLLTERDVWTPDWYTATVLYIEPDVTHKQANKAWLCSNMRPKTLPELLGKRDLQAAGELLDIEIEFSAITETGFGVNVLAQKVLEQLSILNVNPDSVSPSTVAFDQARADSASNYNTEERGQI